MMDKMELVVEAVKEWGGSILTAEEAMWAIWAVVFQEEPTEAAIEWAKTEMLCK